MISQPSSSISSRASPSIQNSMSTSFRWRSNPWETTPCKSHGATASTRLPLTTSSEKWRDCDQCTCNLPSPSSLLFSLSVCLLPLLWEGKKKGVNPYWSYVLLMHPHKRLSHWRALLGSLTGDMMQAPDAPLLALPLLHAL